MGAGVPIKARNARVYRLLKKQQRELQAAGVGVAYRNYSLFHEDSRDIGGGFNVRYSWIFASNGECAAAPVVTIPADVIAGVVLDKTEMYGGWNNTPVRLGTYEQGIARLIELFAPKK
jgi:hypothetical protein